MTTLTDLTINPATHTYTTRVDCRHLATLAMFWHSQQQCPRSSSELLRLSIEALSTSLVNSGQVEFIENLDVAIETLHRFGLKGKPQPRNLQQLQLQIGRVSGGSDPTAIARLHNQKAIGHISPLEHSAALAEFESRLLTHSETDSQQVEDFKNTFKNPDLLDR